MKDIRSERCGKVLILLRLIGDSMNPRKVWVALLCLAVMPIMAADSRLSPTTGNGGVQAQADGKCNDKLTPSELSNLAESFDAPYYAVTLRPQYVPEDCKDLVAVYGVVMESGQHLVLGERIPVGETIVSGIVMSDSSWEDMGLLDSVYPDPDEGTILTPGSMMAINIVTSARSEGGGGGTGNPAPVTCEVVCNGTSYFACCVYRPNGMPLCKCMRNTENGNACDAGGAGSTSCSLTQTPPAGPATPAKPATSPTG